MTLGIIAVSVIFMILGMIVQYRLKSKFAQYSKLATSSGLSGQEIAKKMLRDNGIYDVEVVSVPGSLSDHYNPVNKTVNLSAEVFEGRNIAAAAVASGVNGILRILAFAVASAVGLGCALFVSVQFRHLRHL